MGIQWRVTGKNIFLPAKEPTILCEINVTETINGQGKGPLDYKFTCGGT